MKNTLQDLLLADTIEWNGKPGKQATFLTAFSEGILFAAFIMAIVFWGMPFLQAVFGN